MKTIEAVEVPDPELVALKSVLPQPVVLGFASDVPLKVKSGRTRVMVSEIASWALRINTKATEELAPVTGLAMVSALLVTLVGIGGDAGTAAGATSVALASVIFTVRALSFAA